MDDTIDMEKIFNYIRQRMTKPFFGKFVITLSVHNSQVKGVKVDSDNINGLSVEESLDKSQFS